MILLPLTLLYQQKVPSLSTTIQEGRRKILAISYASSLLGSRAKDTGVKESRDLEGIGGGRDGYTVAGGA